MGGGRPRLVPDKRGFHSGAAMYQLHNLGPRAVFSELVALFLFCTKEPGKTNLPPRALVQFRCRRVRSVQAQEGDEDSREWRATAPTRSSCLCAWPL